jgi:hypothetical protein
MADDLEFDFAGLIAALEDDRTELFVVMIESPDGAAFETYHLDLDRDSVQAPFRRNLAASLRTYSNGRLERYEEGWVPQEREMAAGAASDIDSPLPALVRDGLSPSRLGRPHELSPQQSATDEALGGIRGYAIVLRTHEGGEASLFRRRDPVEHLGKGRLTTVLRGTRLDRLEHTVAFDAGVDAAIWEGRLLVRSWGAFESLFFPKAVRAAVARAVIDRLEARIPIENVRGLRDTADSDSVFAARLRRLEPALATADPAQLQAQITRAANLFGLATRFMPSGRLTFPAEPAWRWPFLVALEDGLVRSAGSGALYQSESKRRWDRRRVTAVVRQAARVTALCGDGWQMSVTDAAKALRRARTTFYVQTTSGQAEVVPDDAHPERLKTVGPADGDALDRLPAP